MNEMNDRNGWIHDCDLMQYPCSDGRPDDAHCNHCLEWQSCAASEGFADFYMIQAWNNKNDGDCDYNDEDLSCEDGGSYIDYIPCCTGSYCNGRGTESDWAHFWWDLYGNEDCSTADINRILAYSEPENWTTESSVYSMIRSAAFDNDLCETNWNWWAGHNGVFY